MITILEQMLKNLERYREEQEKLIEQITQILEAHGIDVSKEEVREAETEEKEMKVQREAVR